MKQYYVHIMTNRGNGVLYVGVTNDLERPVYSDSSPDVRAAIAAGIRVKGWLRKKKIALIESMNPEWKDLSEGWHE